MTSALRLVSVGLLLLTLYGCAVANAIVEPYYDLHLRANISTNADDQGQPLPVVVRVYELRSEEAFQEAGFFDLYDNADSVLGDDLLRTSEVVLRPTQQLTHDMRLDKDTRYVGIIGAFRDIDNADWKLSLRADPQDYQTRYIRVDRRSITLDHNH
ncbi:type VI secretion system lipoprotein TssJ [Marinobacteraceae bacterium S3BR75-40.1]